MRNMRMGMTWGLLSLAIALPAQSAVKGKISKPDGVYRLDLADIFRVADLALVRVSTSQGVTTFSLLSLFNGNHVGHLSSGKVGSFQGALAKRSAAIDTLKVTAAGFKTKSVAISSYDTTVNVSLEADACQPSGYAEKDILTIGDSRIAMPGNQVTRLLTLMKEVGVLGANESSDRREVSENNLDQIIVQYNRNKNVKLLIMDGGGIDLFSAPLGPTSSQVQAVVDKFKTFLQQLKTDGYVQHVIYSLYPVIPSTPNLNANMKPGFSEACHNSPVNC